MSTMRRAHEIQSEAAEKFGCKKSEILFSECLKMAWGEAKSSPRAPQTPMVHALESFLAARPSGDNSCYPESPEGIRVRALLERVSLRLLDYDVPRTEARLLRREVGRARKAFLETPSTGTMAALLSYVILARNLVTETS